MSSSRYTALVVSPNSAIDSYYLHDRLTLGGVNNAYEVIHTAGGKGINMARALRTLGGRPLYTGFVGGHAGAFIADELVNEGVEADLVWTATESRRCNTIFVRDTADTTVTLEPGCPAGTEEIEALSATVLQRAGEASCVAFTGSLVPNMAEDYYANLVRQLHAQGVRSALDCSRQPLVHGLDAGPWLIKVNEEEICGALGLPAQSLTAAEAAAIFARVRAQGCEVLVITLGVRGAYVFSANDAFHVKTPARSVVSTAGAGDTFFAGLLLALSQGKALRAAAALGSAAATTGLMQLGCGVLDPALVPGLEAETQVSDLRVGAHAATEELL